MTGVGAKLCLATGMLFAIFTIMVGVSGITNSDTFALGIAGTIILGLLTMMCCCLGMRGLSEEMTIQLNSSATLNGISIGS